MIRELKTDPLHYVILTVMIGIHLVWLWWFKDVMIYQRIGLLSACISYVLWGIWHHYKTHHLTNWIVLEYCMFALLVFLLGTFLMRY